MFPSAIQTAICRRLNETPYFQTAPAIVAIARCQGDIIQASREAVERTGVVVIVMPGEGKFIRNETPVPAITGTWRIRVEENVAVNRSAGGTRQPAEDIAWAAVQRLLHWIPLDTHNAALTGGPLVPGEISHSESGDNAGQTWFASEFTVTVAGGDSEGAYGAALRRNQ